MISRKFPWKATFRGTLGPLVQRHRETLYTPSSRLIGHYYKRCVQVVMKVVPRYVPAVYCRR